MLSHALALVSTVLLLMALGFFVLGSTPLLVLRHETPMDARVIRQVFHYCYRLVAVMAAGACAGFALQGRPVWSACLGGIALLALAMHRVVLARMDVLRESIHQGDRAAVARFRRLHVAGIALNLAQLGALAWGMTRVTF